MSECPSYLGITINDRVRAEELIKYDLLVFCPSHFGVTFWLPNWGQRSTVTFDVQLRDSQESHAVFLTRLLLDPVAERTALTTTTSVDDADDRELSALFAVIAGVTLTLVLLVVTLCVRLRSSCESGMASTSSSRDVRRKHGRQCRVCAYVTVRVVYSVAISFAAVLLALSILVQPEIELLSAVDGRLSAVSSDKWIDDVDRAAADETLRQVRDARSRHSACTFYVNQLYSVVLERVARVRSNQSRRCVGGGSSGAMERLDIAVKQHAAMTQSAVDDYHHHVSATIATLMSAQTRHLTRLYSNHWFNFAIRMFNDSVDQLATRHLDSLPNDVAAVLSRPEVEFASFVGIDVVRETKTWLDQFWRR